MAGGKLRHLDCFSGIGGFAKGLEDTGGIEPVQFVEQDDFCRRVLAKHWPDVPCHDDVRTFDAAGLGHIDIVTGGAPCQPVSHAGQRRGTEDDRWLWHEMARIVAAVRSRWVIGENVYGLVSMGLDEVLSDLESLGYTVWPAVIPACAVDAPHRRDRVWIVAYCDGGQSERRRELGELGSEASAQLGEGHQRQRAGDAARDCGADVADAAGIRRSESQHEESGGEPGRSAETGRGEQPGGTCPSLADADQPRPQGRDGTSLRERAGERATRADGASGPDSRRGSSQGQGPGQRGCEASTGREPECGLGGVASRLSHRMDGHRWPAEPEGIPRVITGQRNRVQRLKALGNSVVPQVVTALGHAILQADRSLT